MQGGGVAVLSKLPQRHSPACCDHARQLCDQLLIRAGLRPDVQALPSQLVTACQLWVAHPCAMHKLPACKNWQMQKLGANLRYVFRIRAQHEKLTQIFPC